MNGTLSGKILPICTGCCDKEGGAGSPSRLQQTVHSQDHAILRGVPSYCKSSGKPLNRRAGVCIITGTSPNRIALTQLHLDQHVSVHMKHQWEGRMIRIHYNNYITCSPYFHSNLLPSSLLPFFSTLHTYIPHIIPAYTHIHTIHKCMIYYTKPVSVSIILY